MSSFFSRLRNWKNSVNSKEEKKKNVEEVRINIKGQRIVQNIESKNSQMAHDIDYGDKLKGTPFLDSRLRKKVWLALGVAALYFYACYRLIIFRLKSDDLDLMEREVEEEFKLKKKIKELK
jgi:hypothetical protein